MNNRVIHNNNNNHIIIHNNNAADDYQIIQKPNMNIGKVPEQKCESVDEPEQPANGHAHIHEQKYVTECIPFNPHRPKQPGLRANVFVSKDCTRDLSEHIVEENWGPEHGMLYKYLDYIFRCQIFDKQVKKITYSDNEEIVVFHTGLQRRNDHNFLYFVLKTNDPDKKNAEQKWRVPAGIIYRESITTQHIINYLSIQTKF